MLKYYFYKTNIDAIVMSRLSNFGRKDEHPKSTSNRERRLITLDLIFNKLKKLNIWKYLH